MLLLNFATMNGHSAEPSKPVGVIPKPQIERRGEGKVNLGEAGAALGVTCRGVETDGSMPVKSGLELMTARLAALGGRLATSGAGTARGTLLIERCSPAAMARIVGEFGGKEVLDSCRLDQAYFLQCKAEGDRGNILVKACSELGIYYGLVSACQLVERDERNRICAPVMTIADWPEVGLRLAKTSASLNPTRRIMGLARWLPVYKINMIGLQYHGGSSKSPEETFLENVATVCAHARRTGILKTVVYFCPFRGGERAYDFRGQDDRTKYLDWLNSVLEQGADGIEIDYNDWPDKESKVPIEVVINLVCDGIARRHPDAYILYCPPASMYRGMIKPAMVETLSKVPRKVWPLWTGMHTLIDVLREQDVEEWTRSAGRRPFLWINRVFIGGQFSRQLDGQGDAYVFRGEALPRELNRLVEGVHLNAGLSKTYNRLPRRFTPAALAYLATAADFIWNPRDWQAEESYRRAVRFVEITAPLLGDRGLVGKPPRPLSSDHPAWLPIAGCWSEADGVILGSGNGKVAILQSREKIPPDAKKLALQVSVKTLEVSGNMNGFIVFGHDTETGEYYFAGAGFGAQKWLVARARADGQVHATLHAVKDEIPVESSHLLRVSVDYEAGRITLLELADGRWQERLEYENSRFRRVSPFAGLAVKWGETEFKEFEISR